MSSRNGNSSSSSKQLLTNLIGINQHEFESEMYKVLGYGDETDLARAVGKSPAYYSQMLNPDDPRESIWYRAARDTFNLIEIDAERGCRALTVFNSFVKRALPPGMLCVDIERRRMRKERMEADLAEIERLPIVEQIRELEEYRDQVDRYIEAKRSEAITG